MSTDKGYYNSLEPNHKKHHQPIDSPGAHHDHDGCEMKDSDATWASTKIGPSEDLSSSSRGFFESNDSSRNYRFAVNASWAVNWFLLGAKLYAVIISSSKAVTAALVDSIVDILSQAILAMADRYISRHSPDYPVGRSRLEALSVIACAFIMSMASVEVMQYAATDLYNGFNGDKPPLDMPNVLYIIMGVGIVLKFVLWVYCLRLNAKLNSDTVAALAEDHFNDVISNAAAMVTAAIAFHTPAWWLDPVGAVLISLVIIYRWVDIISEQVKKIVGHTAPPEYIEKVEAIALKHDSRLEVDCTRVYHFGARYNVEMEIVLPGDMTVMESHDIALALQHKIESLEDVERAFVHVDHEMRDGLEHKIERNLVNDLRARAMSSDSAESTNNPIIAPNELRSRNSAAAASVGSMNDTKI